MSGPIFFTVTLRTHHDRAYRRLARTLKTALRRDQLRAIKVREETNTARRGVEAQPQRLSTTKQKEQTNEQDKKKPGRGRD